MAPSSADSSSKNNGNESSKRKLKTSKTSSAQTSKKKQPCSTTLSCTTPFSNSCSKLTPLKKLKRKALNSTWINYNPSSIWAIWTKIRNLRNLNRDFLKSTQTYFLYKSTHNFSMIISTHSISTNLKSILAMMFSSSLKNKCLSSIKKYSRNKQKSIKLSKNSIFQAI